MPTVARRRRLPPALGPAWAAAWWGLRTNWGTAALLVAMAGLGLAAALLVALLARVAGGSLEPRLLLTAARGAVLDPSWALARSPASLQSDAVRILFQALAGAAGAALLVAGVGVVLVFAARAFERAGEMTLRRAVGAPGRVLALSGLLEGGAIALAAVAGGGLAGFLFATRAAGTWPGRVIAADAWVGLAAFAVIGVVVLAVLAGALLALMFAPRRRLVDAAPRRVSLAVPAVQLGLALVLLTAGGLIGRHAATVGRQDGAAPRGGVLYRGGLAALDPAARSAQYAALLDRLRAGAAFDTVSLTGDGASLGLGTVSVVTTDCGFCPMGGLYVPWHAVPALHQVVSADTFQSLGLQLLAGRGITDADRWNAPRVAVVSRSLAQRHFQNGDAIGRRLLFGDDPRTWHTVVGIVDDAVPSGLGGALLPPFAVYASVLQHPAFAVELMLRPRAGQSARARAPDLRGLANGAEPVTHIGEAGLRSAQIAPVAWFGRLFTVEGWATLLVALLATVVQIQLWVRSLAPELGLRRAVGARAARVVFLVVGRAALVGVAGGLIGAGLGPALWTALGTVVRGLPAWDGGLLVRTAGLLVGITTLGAVLPAWRATRVATATLLGDPVA